MISHRCALPERDGVTTLYVCNCGWVWRLNETVLHWFRELPAP